MITHPFVVGLQPFQKRSLFSDVFAAVGTYEEADGTTTGGERPWAASEIEDAIFSLLPMSEDWGGSGGWLNKGSAFVDDVTSWEEAAGV